MTAIPRRDGVTECPRVVDPFVDSGRFVTCGETVPCPYHDAPLYVVANPTGGDQE